MLLYQQVINVIRQNNDVILTSIDTKQQDKGCYTNV